MSQCFLTYDIAVGVRVEHKWRVPFLYHLFHLSPPFPHHHGSGVVPRKSLVFYFTVGELRSLFWSKKLFLVKSIIVSNLMWLVWNDEHFEKLFPFLSSFIPFLSLPPLPLITSPLHTMHSQPFITLLSFTPSSHIPRRPSLPDPEAGFGRRAYYIRKIF